MDSTWIQITFNDSLRYWVTLHLRCKILESHIIVILHRVKIGFFKANECLYQPSPHWYTSIHNLA